MTLPRDDQVDDVELRGPALQEKGILRREKPDVDV